MFNLFRKYYDLASTAASIGGIAGGPIGIGASAALQAAIGIGQLLKSAKMNRQADTLERGLVRPEYLVQGGYLDNQALAEYRAQQGLSDAARSVYDTQANRGLTTSVDAILRGGGSVSNIADLYNSAEDDYAKVAMLEEEARLKNQSILMDTNKETAAQQDKQWQLNVYNPYMDKVAAIDRLRNRASATADAGRNLAAGAANNFVTGNLLRGQTGFGTVAGMAGGGIGAGSFASVDNPTYSLPSTAPNLYNIQAPNYPIFSTPVPYAPGATPQVPQYSDYFMSLIKQR